VIASIFAGLLITLHGTKSVNNFALHKPEYQESGKLSTQATSSPTTSQGIDNSEKKVVSADQDTSLHSNGSSE
jgi:hypothetical protein